MVVVVVGLNMVSHHQKHAPPHTHSHSPSLVYSLVFSFLALVQAPFFFFIEIYEEVIASWKTSVVWFGLVWSGLA